MYVLTFDDEDLSLKNQRKSLNFFLLYLQVMQQVNIFEDLYCFNFFTIIIKALGSMLLHYVLILYSRYFLLL